MPLRRPDLSMYPGRYVALDLATDEVLADAATMLEIIEIVRSRGLKASIVRAPREDEPCPRRSRMITRVAVRAQ